MDFLLEAYYVMRLKKYPFAPPPFHHLFTVCHDFNDNLLGHWAYLYGHVPGHRDWKHYFGTNLEADDAALKEKLLLPDLDLHAIRAWVTSQYQAGKLSWGMTFADLETADEYRNQFFGLLPDTYLLSVSYLEADVEELVQHLKANPDQYSKKFQEDIANAQLHLSTNKGKVIGHDIIEFQDELGQLTLKSFLVHDLGGDLYRRFGVELNAYGLLNDETKKEEIMAYMKDSESLGRPLPWAWIQVKLFE